MGDDGSFSRAQCSVLLWAFLQADSGECPEDYRNELLFLRKGFKDSDASHYGSTCEDLETDGHLEADGHLSTSIGIDLEDLEPSVDVHVPANIQQVAAELREIAAQLELNVVARATQNLTTNLLRYSVQYWKEYLHQEVQNILAHGVGLDNLQQERVVAALTFTLVKGVCQQAPILIRSLFDTTLQYLGHGGGR